MTNSGKRFLTIILAVALLWLTGRALAQAPLKDGDRVVFLGDSITEQRIYTRYVMNYFTLRYPTLDVTFRNAGWGGDTAPGGLRRLQRDVLDLKPTVVTICFGMNDGGYRPFEKGIGDTYEAGDRRIETRCKQLGARMIVGGPGPVDSETWKKTEPDADTYYNDNLGKLSAIAGKIAQENGFVFAGLHPFMMKVMQDAKAALGKDYAVCGGDGVHPGANGHLVMAYAFLKAMGLDGNIGTVTVDLADGATATEGHRVLSAEKGKVELESSRYPFCFFGGEKDPNGTRSILPFLPFNRDLNRFTLVVKNLSAPAAEVKWDTASKTFTQAELEAGVNLAEAFLDNPFCAPFSALERVVADKQSRETRAIKGMITCLRGWDADFANDKEFADAVATLRRKVEARCAQDAAAARAAVKPVTHTLQITPK